MQIELEEIKRIRQRIRELNAADLSKIEVTVNGKPVEISKNSIKQWKFFGLSNFSFLEDYHFEEPPSQGRLDLS